MPPPPAPLAHRRTRVNSVNFNLSLPLSPPQTPESPSCALRKMSLSKGATFHVPSSPPAEDDPVLSIPYLARRSPTCSHTSLMSLISDKRDVAAQSIQDFEHTFSGARGKRSSTHRRLSSDFDRQLRQYKRAASPLDEGLGSSISPSSEKELSRTLSRALSFKDSALGSSVKSEGVAAGDDASVQDLIQGWLARCVLLEGVGINTSSEETNNSGLAPSRNRQQGNRAPKATSTIGSAVTQSIAPRSHHRVPRLSKFARQKVKKNILDPILQEERFELFHPLVSSLGPKPNKSIGCLRDLEQSLIIQAQVSTAPNLTDDPDTYRLWLLAQTLAVSQQLYRTFGEFSIQLVLDTYQHLAESEQRRPTERPYDSGYFLDLVQQVGRLAAQVGRRREAIVNGEEAEPTEEDDSYSPYVPLTTINPSKLDSQFISDDEVTLEGGLGETGEIAELVRWRNGKGTSLRTMQPYEPLLGLKRQHSSESLDEDVARSMARRKKGEVPQIIERKCADPTCDKVFTRKCDLAKHEKTHSRPFKCPERTCKYHDQGLPTEKEMQRHINDKHDPNPQYYNCKYCTFKTKRESNCKQHMEKKHGWTYERVKGSGKFVRTPGQTPQTPSVDYSPSPAPSTNTNIWETGSTTPSDAYDGSGMHTPLDQAAVMDFNNFSAVPYSGSLFPNQASQYIQSEDDLGYETSMQAPNYPLPTFGSRYTAPINTQPAAGQYGRSPVTPAYSTITYDQESPAMKRMEVKIDYTSPDTYNGLPTPNSNFLQTHSRNPSISYDSPMNVEGQTFGEDMLLMNGMGTSMNSDAFVSHSQLPVERDFPLFQTEAGPSDYMSRHGTSSYGAQNFSSNMDQGFQNGDYTIEDNDFDVDTYLDMEY